MDVGSIIVAVASAAGLSTRAILRVGGEDCLSLLNGVPRGVHRRRIDGVPVLAYVWRGPRSFTGDDSFELVMAGHPELLARVERTLFARATALGLPLRQAAAGEFSLRAFQRGRIDLTQAEGIAATIAATTDAELAAARELVDGRLGDRVRALADRVAQDLALVEAGIDFTDQEDVVAIEPSILAVHLAEQCDEIDELLRGAGGRESPEALPRIVLTGRPNAGKSTLFNALLGRDRAVAAPIAGTTRDLLIERIALPGGQGPVAALLVDAAGVGAEGQGAEGQGAEGQGRSDPTIGPIDAAARRMAREALARADIILRCVATDEPEDVDAAGLLVRTKADLPLRGAAFGAVAVAARDGSGLDALRALLAARLVGRRASASGERVALAARHRHCLGLARAGLGDARELVLARGLGQSELVAASLRAALDALGSISGAIAPDEVIGRIFASFCVGK